MSLNLRQWLACLLMVLLPLQAFAGVRAVSCADWMAHCPGLASGSDACCNHGTSANSVDEKQTSSNGHSSGMASCTGATTCAPVAAAAALPPTGTPLTFATAANSWLDREPSPFQSHIPDGLRRPPRFLA
jgi:hypothetical protein